MNSIEWIERELQVVARWIELDFTVCDPRRCDPEKGRCAAAAACEKRVLVQEAAFETPVLFIREICRGCRDCMRACPLKAIK